MKEVMLSRFAPGQAGRVTRIEGGEELRRSLLAHGLVEGTYIRCLRRGPGGASGLYGVRGSMLAIRSTDGRCIFAEQVL